MEPIAIQTIYEAMTRIAPPELAESWDNPGLLVDCGRPAVRALTALDITPRGGGRGKAAGLRGDRRPPPGDLLPPSSGWTRQDVPFLLVEAGISAICMHTNFDAAEGGVNDTLAGIFGIRQAQPFANGCGRVGEIDPVTVPALGRSGPGAPGGPLRAAPGRARRTGQIHRQRPPGEATWPSSAGRAAASLPRPWPPGRTAC